MVNKKSGYTDEQMVAYYLEQAHQKMLGMNTYENKRWSSCFAKIREARSILNVKLPDMRWNKANMGYICYYCGIGMKEDGEYNGNKKVKCPRCGYWHCVLQ